MRFNILGSNVSCCGGPPWRKSSTTALSCELTPCDAAAERYAIRSASDRPAKPRVPICKNERRLNWALPESTMSASENIRSTTGEVQTRLPGITFGGTFPQMANLADRLSVVRSFQSRNGGHEYTGTISGGFPGGAAMSAIYARLAGSMHPTRVSTPYADGP